MTGYEVGPFMSIEQAALSQLAEKCTDNKEQIPKNISAVFGYYNIAGYLAQALGVFLRSLVPSELDPGLEVVGVVGYYDPGAGICRAGGFNVHWLLLHI